MYSPSYKLQPLVSSRPYELLPRSSLESDDDPFQFKDKPLPHLPRRWYKFLRPTYLLSFLLLLLASQLLFNNSYASPPPFLENTTETVFIAANIVDKSLIQGAWGDSLVELVKILGKDRVHVSIYGGPKVALQGLAARLDCENSVVAEEDVPLDMGRIPRTVVPSTGQEKIKRIAYLAEIRNMALLPLKNSPTKFDKVLFINDVFFNPTDVPRLLWGTNRVGEGGKAEYRAACAVDFMKVWKFYDTFATRDAEGFSVGVPLYPWFTGAGEAISRNDVLAGKDNVRVKSCWGGMIAFDAEPFQHQTIYVDRSRNAEAELLVEKSAEYKPPVSFRSWQPEPYWDASECCLIHADVAAYFQQPSETSSPKSETQEDATLPSPTRSQEGKYAENDPYDTGIYMNPYIRVSYSLSTHRWLTFIARFERLFYPIQTIINYFAGLPRFNSRRLEVEGDVIADTHWVLNNTTSSSIKFDIETKSRIGKRSNELHTTLKPASWWTENGQYEEYDRVAQRGAYCLTRQLMVVKEQTRGGDDTGGMWDKLVDELPPLGS